MVELAETLYNNGYDVCIMSAADRDTIRDKWEWIDTHMPFIEKENICFCPIGADKTQFVKGNAEISVLIDDYPKNLDEWIGTPVKAINSVNSHQNRYYEIDGVQAENDFAKWDDIMAESVGTISMLVRSERCLDDVLDETECSYDSYEQPQGNSIDERGR